MLTVSAGPLALSTARLLLLAGFAVALLIGWLIGRRRGLRVEPVLTGMAISGLVGARLAFVGLYANDYLSAPFSIRDIWAILDIRDGGFLISAGVGVAALWALFWFWRDRALAKPVTVASLSGVVAWALGSWLLLAPPEEQPPLPPISLTTLQGDAVNLHEFRGKPMVVNLWATWCLPCRREMPVLEAAQQQEDDIHFIFLNQAEEPGKIQDYLDDEDLRLSNVLLDSTSISSRLLLTRGLPATYFFDADGTMKDYHVGELSRATLSHKLRRLR